MKRRSFFLKSATISLGLGLGHTTLGRTPKNKQSFEGYFTIDQHKVKIYNKSIREKLRIMHIADTHLFKDDVRGKSYQQYSDRMAGAYNTTRHFQTGEETNPEQTFVETLTLAQKEKFDFIGLVGDIFSFPSQAAIEWVQEKLQPLNIPYAYVAGNHDWHYEGMQGTLEELRGTWIEKRLKPLYQGNNPLMAAYNLKGVRIVTIDNSTYQINAEQLAFFQRQVVAGKPMVLLVHIPLYAPGKSISFGCGHPDWGAGTDHIYKIERRPRWPESGHTDTTYEFYKAVCNAPNLLGIFAGHIHRPSVELINGKPQVVADDNASGGYLDIELIPLAEKDEKLLSLSR